MLATGFAPMASEAVTNVVYTVNPAPPIVYQTGKRLMLDVAWEVGENARGFIALRFVTQEPESVASPVFSAVLFADGNFDMVPQNRAAKMDLQSLVASGAARHTRAVQLYPSANATKLAGDFSGVWTERVEDVSGDVEVVICGEGISLATLQTRWTTNPTLFLLK